MIFDTKVNKKFMVNNRRTNIIKFFAFLKQSIIIFARHMQDQTLESQISKSAFQNLKQVRVQFRFLKIFVANESKLRFQFPPTTKLLEVKQKLDSEINKKITLYLRESFIPSLNSTIGDLALCYGYKDNDETYSLTFSASQEDNFYG